MWYQERGRERRRRKSTIPSSHELEIMKLVPLNVFIRYITCRNVQKHFPSLISTQTAIHNKAVLGLF